MMQADRQRPAADVGDATSSPCVLGDYDGQPNQLCSLFKGQGCSSVIAHYLTANSSCTKWTPSGGSTAGDLQFCFSRPGKLPSIGLIKLRDLPDNLWNVDTLYILTAGAENAHRLAAIIEAEDWGGMVQLHDNEEDVQNALGGGEPGQAVVLVWWD